MILFSVASSSSINTPCLSVCLPVCASHFLGRYLIDFSVKFHTVTLWKETRFFVFGHTDQISALWWAKSTYLLFSYTFAKKIVNDTQKLERFHDANLEVVIMTATGATSDDKVSIMMSYISVYLAFTRYWPYRYRPRDRIATILWMTYSNVFSCMKMSEFWIKFHWSELTVVLAVQIYFIDMMYLKWVYYAGIWVKVLWVIKTQSLKNIMIYHPHNC